MREVLRRLEELKGNSPDFLLREVVRADDNPFQQASMPCLILQEPDESYDVTHHPLCRVTMTLRMVVSIRDATQAEKAPLCRSIWLAIWNAMLPPNDPNLGGLVVVVLPQSASIIVNKDPEPISLLTMRWQITYDFLLTDPTVTA